MPFLPRRGSFRGSSYSSLLGGNPTIPDNVEQSARVEATEERNECVKHTEGSSSFLLLLHDFLDIRLLNRTASALVDRFVG